MPVLFFARYSIVQCILLYPEIRAAKVVYFQPVIRSRDRQVKIFTVIVKKLINLINKSCELKTYDKDQFIVAEWTANAESMSLIAQSANNLSKASPVNFLIKLLKDNHVIKYFQGTLTFYMPAWLAFTAAAEESGIEDNGLCIPAWSVDNTLTNKIGTIRTKCMLLAYKIQHFVQYLFYTFAVLFFPLFYLIFNLHRGFKLGSSRQFYLISMPVVWGFFREGENTRDGISKQIDDSYIYGGDIHPGDIVHIFGKWKFSKKKTKEYKSIMGERGYQYCASVSYKINLEFIKTVLHAQLFVFLNFLSLFKKIELKRENVLLVKSLIKALYYYMEKHLELTNIGYKVNFVKDDYNPGHVIETSVMKAYGIKTIGIQHTASPYDAPQLNFIYMDRYCVYGKFYEELFSEGWKDIHISKTGREVIDSISNIVSDSRAMESIKSRFEQVYGNTKYRILLLVSGPAYVNRIKMWEEFYEGLSLISKLKMDYQIIIKLREISHVEKFHYIRKIIELAEHDRRFITQQQGFSTQQLIPICDLVITPNSSFGINESVAANKKVYTFDLTGAAKLYFRKYGDSFVLETRDDILSVIKSLETNFKGNEYDWDGLSRDLNYYTDGRNSERIRSALLSGLQN